MFLNWGREVSVVMKNENRNGIKKEKRNKMMTNGADWGLQIFEYIATPSAHHRQNIRHWSWLSCCVNSLSSLM